MDGNFNFIFLSDLKLLDNKCNIGWCRFHLHPLTLPSPDPLLQQTLPDLVDIDPHTGDEHAHGDPDNILKFLLPMKEDVVEGDTEQTDTACKDENKANSNI